MYFVFTKWLQIEQCGVTLGHMIPLDRQTNVEIMNKHDLFDQSGVTKRKNTPAKNAPQQTPNLREQIPSNNPIQ